VTDRRCPPDASTVKEALAALDGTVTSRTEAADLTVTSPNGRGLSLRAVD
jgi:hypothetical protein